MGKERREPKKKQSQGWTQREASAQHCRRRPPARKHLLDLRASFTLAARSIARPTPGPRRGGRVAIPPPKRMKRVVRKRVRGKFWGPPSLMPVTSRGSSLRRRRQGLPRHALERFCVGLSDAKPFPGPALATEPSGQGRRNPPVWSAGPGRPSAPGRQRGARLERACPASRKPFLSFLKTAEVKKGLRNGQSNVQHSN